MKSKEFLYWLQGLFELCEIKELNETQVKTIQRHLQMVEVVEKGLQYPFCFWIRGVLETHEKIDERVTKIIKDKLNNLFTHVVEDNLKNSKQSDNTFDLSNQNESALVRC